MHLLRFNFCLTYLIVGARAERFTLNPMTGELKAASPLSWGERPEYTFMVTAADHGTPGLSSTCRLQIQVIIAFAFSCSPVRETHANRVAVRINVKRIEVKMRRRENKTCACKNKRIFQTGCELPTPEVSAVTEIQSEKARSAGRNFLGGGQFCVSAISGITKKRRWK